MKEADSNSPYIDLTTYVLPNDRGKDLSLTKIYEPIPRKGSGVDFDIYDYEMLFNDEPTVKLIREGRTIGCFYIESPGMRSLLRRLSVDTFEMLTAASSIIRPGVAESGMMQEFILRHKDPSRRKYLVPEMKKYLGSTYGLMIYQEDVLRVAHHIIGLSLEEADLLRRAMSGKMRSRDAMSKLQGRFREVGLKRGLKPEVVAELWRQVSSFAGYAFCKSHSACYALLSYQVAYLKAHYPAEFMSSVLSNRGGYYSPAVYIQESRRLGLKVALPCVNKSEYEYTCEGKTIRIGFMAIKGLSTGFAERIIVERKRNGRYVSLADFIVRLHPGPQETALLIKAGAMDCFKQTRPTLLRLLDVYLHNRRLLDGMQYDLFAADSFELERKVVTKLDYSPAEKLIIEMELFGYAVTKHPLEFFTEYISRPDIVPASAMRRYNGRTIKMIGWYMTAKRIKTKKGDIMKFLSLEDLTGTYEAVLFPKAYSMYAEETMSMGPYLVEGKVDMENGDNLIVNKLELVSSADTNTVKMNDSVEHNFFGEEEKIYEEEFNLVNELGREAMVRAYAG